ncbi:hypothetical protein PENSOL_c001G08408 [Penicillium solitum]|uniref:Uncharacterized protein n=1 Tax=Penicillium solitum TaxID=60172 RepID=A0A1V6RPD4_9EURO|nr:uncharacterized protein PENSOL_c001G08408 [Penicillium solitum]OQE03637.1 hypothetical protein PENSOL_c001G08408 [Penicillium solitum]
MARIDDQIRSLHAATTALSNENAYLQQQMKATPAIPHELAEQQVRDAVASTMLFADQKHEEVVRLLEQTHGEELMAAKAGHEKESEEAYNQLESERDGFLTAGERLQARCDRLESEADDLARGLKALEDENLGLKGAVDYLADEGEKFQQQIEQLKDDNRALLDHNEELLCQTVVSDLDLQQTRGRVGNLERKVADFEAADITAAVSGMEFSAE